VRKKRKWREPEFVLGGDKRVGKVIDVLIGGDHALCFDHYFWVERTMYRFVGQHVLYRNIITVYFHFTGGSLENIQENLI